MSVAVPMASPSRRLDLDDQPFLNSRISAREKDMLGMTKHRTSSVNFFGVELCPNNVAVAMVFCSRCPRPCRACCQFLTFHLKDDLHLHLAEVKVLTVCQSRSSDNLEAEESETTHEKEARSYGSLMMERVTGSKEGRIDHVLQDKTFQHPYLAAIGAHTNYWRDYDTALFILKHLY